MLDLSSRNTVYVCCMHYNMFGIFSEIQYMLYNVYCVVRKPKSLIVWVGEI